MPSLLDYTLTLAPRASSPALPAADTGDAVAADSVADPLPVGDPERYEQLGEHARGGIGRVTRARDRRLGRLVAVKELIKRDAGHEARFVREALITARLDHPGIVPVLEAGRWPSGEPYYVMKLVAGRTLHERFACATTLRDRLALLPHVVAVADAVGYAHREGVIHRDIKPANIVIGEFGETVVVDWGLAHDAKLALPELVEDDGVLGTPAYMAPELASGSGSDLGDPRGDVYAIGAIVYELLSGRPPYYNDPDDAGATRATPRAILARAIAGPPVAIAGPRALVAITDRAMARDPAARYADAVALAAALRGFLAGAVGAPARRAPRSVAFAAAGIVAAAAVGLVAHVHGPSIVAPAAAVAPSFAAPAVPARARDVVLVPVPAATGGGATTTTAAHRRVVLREVSCDGDDG
jgi:hypothetical protein